MKSARSMIDHCTNFMKLSICCDLFFRFYVSGCKFDYTNGMVREKYLQKIILKTISISYKNVFHFVVEYLISVVLVQNIYIVEPVWRQNIESWPHNIAHAHTNPDQFFSNYSVSSPTTTTIIYLLPHGHRKTRHTWCKNKNGRIMVCTLLT